MLNRICCPVLAMLMAVSLCVTAGPLHQAVRARDYVTLEMLLESHVGSSLDATIQGGITPLHLAAAMDQADMVELLIDRGASVNVANTTGFTPLHWAASRNALGALEVLLASGADLNAKAANEITPLHWASARNATRAVLRLVDAGADLLAVTTLGYTPLHLAVKENPYSETSVFLAKTRADIEDQMGFVGIGDLPPLPDPGATTEETPAELPAMQASPTSVAQPGTFLSVPLGLGDSLNFVWLEEVGIWFGKYEITNARYRRFAPRHTSRSIEGLTLNDPDQPVVYVSWEDAMAFCNWLNQQFGDRIPAGFAFRLPTEFEWMLAASAGDTRRYPWGNQWPPLYGNFSDMTARQHLSQWRGITSYNDGFAATAPVEHSGMSELRIYGLAGNVWEWTMDWQHPERQQFKIRKGGSWDFDKQDSLRIAARGLDRPDARYDTIGFRVVVAPAKP